MKKSILARGFIGSVASLLGVMAVGCGADTGWEGAAGEGEIGVSEQAVTVASTGLDDLTTALAKRGAAHCVINDGTKDLLLVAGGLDNSGVITNTFQVYDPSQTAGSNPSAQLVASGTFGTDGSGGSADDRRVNAKLIRNPANAAQCVLVGGDNGSGTLRQTTFRYTHGSGFASAVNLPHIRSGFQLAACGTQDNILAIGGKNGANFVTIIDRYDFSAQSWADLEDNNGDDVELNAPRQNFAAAFDASGRIVVSGGEGASAKLASTEVLIPSNASCSAITSSWQTVATAAISNQRDKTEAVFLGTTGNVSKFAVVGGLDTTPAASPKVDILDIDMATLGSSTKTALTDMGVGIVFPRLTQYGSGNHFMVVGGESATPGPLANVEEYKASVRETAASMVSRFQHVAAYLPSYGKVLILTGRDGTGSVLDVESAVD